MANQYLNKTGLSRLVYKIKTLIQDMSKEAYLVWGGKNVAGDVSPVDAAACDDTNANRLAFHPADCIDVEYSTDGGSTWLDYEATDVNKTTLVTTSNYFYIGKKSASKATINDKLRITLTAKANHHYWHCQKILMWISTSGANDCKVLVETRHINETSFSQYGEYNITGWGGWNSIPFSAYFSAQTNTGHVHKIRLTFTAGSVSGDYNSNLSIGKLRMIAPTCYLNANGELGLNGRIYSLSADKSVTFPNEVTATSFVGATATSTSSGLMSAADKKSLDELPTTKISSSASSKGVKVSLGGTVKSPTISIETTTNGVASNNSGVVSGAEVKNYVDTNAASTATFKSQTSSSNAVNGLVPAPTLANSQKYLRGDGTWQTPVSVINNLESTSTTGALSAAQGKILNEKFGVGVYDLGAFYNYGYSETAPSNGCLIEIGEVASATIVTLQITGFAYYKHKPINSMFVFYDWKNNSGVLEIVQYGGINLGDPVGNLMVYHYDGKVYAWIKQTSDFNTLSFKLYSNKNNLSPIVTNAAMHTNGVTLLTEIEPESPLSASTESSDGLMESTDKKNLNTIKKWYDNIVGVDEDKVINKWDEIVSFLSGIPEGDTLDGLIEAVKTQVGDLKDDIEDGTVIAQESKTLGHETIGSTKKPIYLNNGTATPIDYTIEKSVPSDAVFTDTHYTAKNIVSNSAGAIETAAAANGEVHINLVENGTWRSGINITGSGATLVTSDEWGNITITSDDTNTTYVAMKGATSSSAGTMGLVPAPAANKHTSFLRGDGTWVVPTNTTYSPATSTANGLLSSADKIKLDSIANSANAYSLPNATSTVLGGVKIGSNISVNSGTISLTKSNVTSALGYTPPTSDTNTTYTAGSGLSLSGTSFSLKTGYATTGKNYAVQLDSNGNPYVNVPWTDTDTNTTYNVVTSSVAGLAPKIGTAAAATIGTQSTEWVLTSTSGGTPTWRKLPKNAFKDTNTTYNAREFVGDYTYDLGSFYSYANGCLIEIGKSVDATMVAIHVTGNGYGATKPINSMYQFYDYNTSSGITQGGAICLGASTGDMVVYRYNNKVYAWIKQQQQYQTLSFRLYTNKSELSPVVTNAAAHTSGISNKITISPSGIYAGVNTTTPDWSNSTDARKGIELLQTVGSAPTSGSAPSSYSVGLRVSGYYSFMLANDVSNNAMRCYRNSTNGWETFITDKNIATYKAGDSSKLGGVAASSYATKDDIANGNITAAKATTADSANAIGGKGLNDLVQGGGTIKYIKVVTSLPASPSNDTLYLIKQ